MRFLSGLALVLIIIGALNWGLWGFFQFDLVAWLFGGNTVWLSRLVYAVVGLAGLWSLRFLGKMGCFCHICCCKNGSNQSKGGGCCGK